MRKVLTLSPLAHLVDNPRDVSDRIALPVFGTIVHTTGRGVVRKAMRLGITPLECVIAYYTTPGAPAAHYVIDWDGVTAQIADEKEKLWHAGISGRQRLLYLSGKWRGKVRAAAATRWDARWPGKRGPAQLYPSRSVNEDYLGVELIPLLQRDGTGSLYTPAQYKALGLLLSDIAQRHLIHMRVPDGRRPISGRLLGHEDIEPLERWNSRGGWDPGSLCANPFFFWDRVRVEAPR